MSLIVFKVVPRLNKWSIMHNDVALATFPTREEAERAALAVAARHPQRNTAALDLIDDQGQLNEIRIF